MELYHHCSRKIKGSVNIARCLEDCKLCKNEPDRKEIMLFVGKKNGDGHVVLQEL